MTTRRAGRGGVGANEPEEELDVQQPHVLEPDSSSEPPDSEDVALELEVEAQMDALFATDEDEDDEYEMDDDEEEDEELSEPEAHPWFSYRNTAAPREVLSQLRKLPVPLEPLCCDLSQQLNLDTAGANTRGPRLPGSMDVGRDPLQSISACRAAQLGPKRARSGSVDPPLTRSRSRAQRTSSDTSGSSADTDQTHGTRRVAASNSKRAASQGAANQASRDAAGAGPSSSAATQAPESGFRVLNTARLLLKREVALGSMSGFSRQQQRHLACYRNMPNTPTEIMDAMSTRAYIGQYSSDGKFFVAAYQDRRVRLYDCSNKWALRKDVTTRMTRWTITDTTLSPDQRFLVYASITPVAYLVHVGSNLDVVESMANVNDLHDALPFDNVRVSDDEQEAGRPWQARRFGIWSIAWSPAGGEIVAGTNDECCYVYNLETGRSHIKLADHKDDVNAVTYLDESGNIIASGSDDKTVKIWDRRLTGATCRVPVGVFVGHTEGVTHIDARGDGRHLISNSKDQTIKMWDMRKGLLSPQEVAALPHKRVPSFHWDYRMDDYPGTGYEVRHPHDQSLATYRGHTVVQTLIRAYFSPAFSTGQRFIYSGSAAGDVNVWDTVTTKHVARLKHHRAPVRDVSWHPTEPELVSTSWDGCIVRWTAKGVGDEEGAQRLPVQRRDRAHYY